MSARPHTKTNVVSVQVQRIDSERWEAARDVHCPSCAESKVWRLLGEGVSKHLCLACGVSFSLIFFRVATGATKQVLAQIRNSFINVHDIGLSVRAANCLVRGGIYRLPDLLGFSPADLLSTPGIGLRTLQEVQRALAAKNLRLRDE